MGSFGTTIRNFLRKILINNINKKRLKNKDFSIISSNCNGGGILHDLGVRFNSPFINLWMKPDDFIKFCKNINYYLNCRLCFVEEKGVSYPVGVLEDIRIYFMHYTNADEAKAKWVERVKRVNFNNLYFMLTDRDECSYQNLKEFDDLPYKNKVVFTHKPYPEIKSSYYIKGFENQASVGMLMEYKNKFSVKKYYDDFDYVAWFNHNNLDKKKCLSRESR